MSQIGKASCRGGERMLRRKETRNERRRKNVGRNAPHGGVARKNNKGVAICSMMKAAKQNHPSTKKDAMRNYITQHVPGKH
ncbi:MAG: hypothetical protein IKL02_05735, partial [Kiritimatiellae bacterium]|nr:hypothetical protein [Kiritimatiellia bacterium]